LLKVEPIINQVIEAAIGGRSRGGSPEARRRRMIGVLPVQGSEGYDRQAAAALVSYD
jgi:hypothetical protein